MTQVLRSLFFPLHLCPADRGNVPDQKTAAPAAGRMGDNKRMSGDLFQPGDAPDQAYRNLRDADDCAEWKAFCESLWSRFAPYADRHFLKEIQIQFHQRFWEMYLTVAFLDRGYTLHKHRDGGPEFGIDIEERRYWLDAVAPMPGTGQDAVPQLEHDAKVASKVPQEQIILRIMNALDAKREKWKKDLARDRVSENDGYIVAINDRAIRWAWLGAEMPYVVMLAWPA